MNFVIIILLCLLATTKVTLQSRFGKKRLSTQGDNLLFNLIFFLSAAILFSANLPKASGYTWIFAAVFALLTVIFQLSYTTALSSGNVSLTVMIVNLSMFLPIMASVLLYSETLTLPRLFGILLTFLSFLLCADTKEKQTFSAKWLLFAVTAALANGGIGITQKIFGESAFSAEKGAFVACSYALAFSLTLLIFTLALVKGEKAPACKTPSTYLLALLVGTVLAVFQWLNTYAISIIDGSFLFPLYSGGSIILSSTVGMVFFKDRLTNKQKISILIGILAVIIMNL